MSEHVSDIQSQAALQIDYPSREAFLEEYDREFVDGRAAVEVEKPLACQERVELWVTFPGLRAALRLRGLVTSVEEGAGHRPTLNIELHVRSSAWPKLQQMVERIRAADPSLVAPVVRVLLVEDNPHVARLIREGLDAYCSRSGQEQDFDISVADNGKQALAHLEAAPCDVLVSDVYLPVLDGVQLFTAIRNNARLQRLPIIAMSAGGEEVRERALAAGADCFLEKPLLLADVLGAVRRVLGGRC
jgi:CheY-like chemotaxis protein